jgi:hypothetical protein
MSTATHRALLDTQRVGHRATSDAAGQFPVGQCAVHALVPTPPSPSAEHQWYIAVFDTGPRNDLAYDQALCSALLVDYHRTSR